MLPEAMRAPLIMREKQVVRLLAEGENYREISREIGLTVQTVKDYANSARFKFPGVKNRCGLVYAAYESGEISKPDLLSDRPLIDQECIDLLPLMIRSLTAKEIARERGEPNTNRVRRDLKRLLGALGAKNPAHAVTMAIRIDLIKLRPKSRRGLGA